MTSPELTEVKSSNISHIGYSEADQTLFVRFKNSGLYSYAGVSKEEYEKLQQAESVGKHFHAEIRSKYVGVKITEEAAAQMEFRRMCTRFGCGIEVPEDRLRRRADTCSTDCKTLDRRAYKRMRKSLGQKRLLASPWFRKLVKEARDTVTR